MAPRKRQETRDGATTEELPTLPSDAQDERAERTERDIDDVLSEVGSSAVVRIHRINPESGNAAYAGTMKADDFSLDALTDVYGGGAYWLRVFDGKEQVEKVRVEIDSSIPARNPRTPKQIAAQSQQSPMDLIIALSAAQADSSRKSMELMSTMMAAMGTAMTTMMAASREAHPKEQNPLELLKAASEILRPSPTKGAVSELKDLLEVAEMIRPQGGGDDGTMNVVSKAIDTVGEIVKRQPVRQQRPPQALPQITPAAAPIETPVAQPDILRPWLKAIFPQLPLVRVTLGQVSPGTAAGVIRDRLSDEEFGDLVTDLTDGLSEQEEITPEKTKPFAARTIAALKLAPEHEDWLSQTAVELLLIANDELGDDETTGPRSISDESRS